MADIFSSRPGQLIKLQTSTQGLALITLSGLFPSPLLIGTTFGVDRSQDTDYQKSLTGLIYGYAFGEAVGRIQIGGLAFFDSCSGGGSSMDTLQSYYDANNIYTKTAPTVIGIGNVSFSGYLETMSTVVENAEFNYGSFNFVFSRIPPRTS